MRPTVTGPAPKWAVDLIEEINKHERRKVYNLQWSRSRVHQHTSGKAWGFTVRVVAGSDRTDQRVVLLHEVAHVVAGCHHHHDREMYRVAWRLWRTYAKTVPVKYIFDREGTYRATCLSVAKELGIRGARAALTERRKNNAGRTHRHRWTLLEVRQGGFADVWWRAYRCDAPWFDSDVPCGAHKSSNTRTAPTAEELRLVAEREGLGAGR